MPSPLPVSDEVHVGVVFGGASGEHEVSILSARTVVSGLRQGKNADRYRLSCFYVDRRGTWWPPEVADVVLNEGIPMATDAAWGTPPPLTDQSPPSRGGFRGLPEGALQVEVWFPVMHGPNGEDGTVQGLFTLMRVPFVGSSVLGSAVGMDKQAMKAAFAAAGLPQVPYECVEVNEDLDHEALSRTKTLLKRLEQVLGYPCFVKPANMGSSVGISKATNRSSLLEGLRAAAAFDSRLVVEKGVVARELECAVLGVKPQRASLVGEIRFESDWYDYQTKYSGGLSQTMIPAMVPEVVSERARVMALDAARAVGASGLSRVDFFYSEAEGDQLWLNEINTMPGFTSQSMYPMLWEASGLPLPDLVHVLIQGAAESHRRSNTTGAME